MGNVGRELTAYFSPHDDETPRRVHMIMPVSLHEQVASLAKRLGMSWSVAAVTLLRGAVQDAEEWLRDTGFEVGEAFGMKPEHMEALQVGPLHDLYEEAVRTTGFVHGGKAGRINMGPELRAYYEQHGQMPQGWLEGGEVDYSRPPKFGGSVPEISLQEAE